jgi:hypothetical protein
MIACFGPVKRRGAGWEQSPFPNQENSILRVEIFGRHNQLSGGFYISNGKQDLVGTKEMAEF